MTPQNGGGPGVKRCLSGIVSGYINVVKTARIRYIALKIMFGCGALLIAAASFVFFVVQNCYLPTS